MDDVILQTMAQLLINCSPYAFAWAFGKRAFKFIIDCFTGRDVDLS